MPRSLEAGDRVRHNYDSGHGHGTVVGTREPSDERLSVEVLWDSGDGPYPYTHNAETQEIVPLKGRASRGRGVPAHETNRRAT